MPFNGEQHQNDDSKQQYLNQSSSMFAAGERLARPPSASDWNPHQANLIHNRLVKHLGPEFVSYRPAPGGGRVSYLEGWKAISLANDTFGFNGWSSEIRNISMDYCDIGADKRVSLGVTALIRVTLKDGTFHEDVGFGHIENAKTKYMAFDKCKKEATTDALKRALRKFGNSLGNCLYNNSFSKQVAKVRAQPFILNKDNLVRETDFCAGYNAHTDYLTAQQDPSSATSSGPILKIEAGSSSKQPKSTPPTRPNSSVENSYPTPAQVFPVSKTPQEQRPPSVHIKGESSPKGQFGNNPPKPRSATVSMSSIDQRPIVGPDSMYVLAEGESVDWDDEFFDGNDDEIFGAEEYPGLSDHHTPGLLDQFPSMNHTNPSNIESKTLESKNDDTRPSRRSKSLPPISQENKIPPAKISPHTSQQEQQEYKASEKTLSDPPKEVRFYKATVAEIVQENQQKVPQGSQFDPSFVSPQIRRTLTHNKSVPVFRRDLPNNSNSLDSNPPLQSPNSNFHKTRAGSDSPQTESTKPSHNNITIPPNQNINIDTPTHNSISRFPQAQLPNSGSPVRGYGSPRQTMRPIGKPPVRNIVYNNSRHMNTNSNSDNSTNISSNKRPMTELINGIGGSGDSTDAKGNNTGNSNGSGKSNSKLQKSNSTSNIGEVRKSPSEDFQSSSPNSDKRQKITG